MPLRSVTLPPRQAQRLTCVMQFALSVFTQPGNGAGQTGLARTGLAHQCQAFTSRHAQRHIEQYLAVVGHVQVLDLQQWLSLQGFNDWRHRGLADPLQSLKMRDQASHSLMGRQVL
ncbi:hypothetical protein D3C81_1720370 [compost metagenome]